jgi:hypothetical protein
LLLSQQLRLSNPKYHSKKLLRKRNDIVVSSSDNLSTTEKETAVALGRLH